MLIEFAGACVERNSWTSGELLTGEIVLSHTKLILTRSVTVLLTGREKSLVQTTEFSAELEFSGHIAPKVSTKTFKERKILLKKAVTLSA